MIHTQRFGASGATGWSADETAPLHAANRAAADFCRQIYADPDWRRFPLWQRILNAVSLRPFLALERQFFIKPRLIHERLLASLQQSAHTCSELKRRIDRQKQQIVELDERVAALESLLRACEMPAAPAPPRDAGRIRARAGSDAAP